MEEIIAAVKGRHQYNRETKEWDVLYRPNRELWIHLLKAIQPQIFALPPDKVKTEKVFTQYEKEEVLGLTKMLEKPKGIDAKYQTVRDPK